MNYFDQINYFIRSTESSFVNLLSSIAPWLAPLAPAYMTYYHMTEELIYPVSVAIAVAAVVEVLGLSSISTILAFWAHNRRYKKDHRKAPVGIALFSFVAYLMVVLTINVLLDASKAGATGLDPVWVQVFARALLTLLSIPAAVILAVRTQHKELLDDIEDEREARKAARESRQPERYNPRQRLASNKKRQFFEDLRTGRLPNYLAQNNLELTAATIADRYQISERNAFRWLKEAKEKSG